jgi:hypothetical protein
MCKPPGCAAAEKGLPDSGFSVPVDAASSKAEIESDPPFEMKTNSAEREGCGVPPVGGGVPPDGGGVPPDGGGVPEGPGVGLGLEVAGGGFPPGVLTEEGVTGDWPSQPHPQKTLDTRLKQQSSAPRRTKSPA